MPNDPVEVTPLQGTEGADVLYLTFAAYLAGDYNSTEHCFAYGGNDVIVRDRSGSYAQSGGIYFASTLHGGGGFDVVNYVVSDYAISANLGQGVGETGPHPTPGFDFGVDIYDSIEGLFGSRFGDHIIGSAGTNRLWGHDGNDALWGEAGNDTVDGGLGNDILRGGSGRDELYGQAGVDSIEGGDGIDLLMGGDGADTLKGQDQNDSLYGGDHNDRLEGGSGNDLLRGDAGQDHVYGGSGLDRIEIGGSGGDTAYGGADADTVVYAEAVTVVLGSSLGLRSGASDALYGVENVTTGGFADVVFGTSGTNEIRTGGGADSIYTVGGSDLVLAGTGNDVVLGYGGAERLYGESGNDALSGSGGADLLRGGEGADRIRGGESLDDLWGEGGADTFEWRVGDVGIEGADVVHDFALTQDRLTFGPGFFEGQSSPGFDVSDALVASAMGGGWTLLRAHLDVGGWRDVAVLKNVNAAALQARIDDGSIFATAMNLPGGDGFGDLA